MDDGRHDLGDFTSVNVLDLIALRDAMGLDTRRLIEGRVHYQFVVTGQGVGDEIAFRDHADELTHAVYDRCSGNFLFDEELREVA